MAQALYRKWRPQTFDDVVGQQHIVRTLRNALREAHIHHAYLFAGPRGTGKTTTARLIAKAVNCLAPVEERPCNQCRICQAVAEGRLMDLIEIDAASNTGVDNVRDLLEKVGFRPTEGRYKVYVVDEVHMLSTAAFNALLKTLEEPPEHVIFVLATTEAHKIPATVLSRCQRFEFRRIALEAIVSRLRHITEVEGFQAEPAALDLIARAATGSMRDAISLLDQMTAEGSVTADYVRLMLGAERREIVQSLVKAWLDRDMQEGLAIINRAMDGGADPRQLARQTSDFLRGLLLMRLGSGAAWTDPTEEERPRFAEMAKRADLSRLVEAVQLFSDVVSQRFTGWQPQLPLELAFVEASMEKEPSISSLKGPEQTAPKATQAQKIRAAASEPSAYQPGATASTSKRVNEGTTAAEAKPAAATPPATQTSPALSIEQIREQWRDILQQMRKAESLKSVAALLHGGQPMGYNPQGALVIGFRHTFHRNKVNTDENRIAVEEFLSNLFNSPIRVRCELEKEVPAALSSLPPTMTSPEKKENGATTSKPKADAPPKVRAKRPPPPEPPVESWEEDELIKRAKRELGAVPHLKD